MKEAASRRVEGIFFPVVLPPPSSFLLNRGHGGRKNKLSSCPSRSPLVGSWHLSLSLSLSIITIIIIFFFLFFPMGLERVAISRLPARSNRRVKKREGRRLLHALPQSLSPFPSFLD